MQKTRLYRIGQKILREDLATFIAKSFSTINPGTPFLANWHIDLIAEYLMACTRGEIRRLIINMPPRALKSQCISVAWPAWLLGNNPSERIIAASYAQTISLKHSLDCRALMEAPFYRDLFPEMEFTGDQNEKHKFLTTARGFRLATSVGGSLTGEGGNFLIVDDPHNPAEVSSRTMRQFAHTWFENTFASRLDQPGKGCIVIVMQRLHRDDLSGYLLQKSSKTWEHLVIPAEAERDTLVHFGRVHHARKMGESWHAARVRPSQLSAIKEEVGSYVFAAQYQQAPVPEAGALIKPQWFRYADIPASALYYQSWDTAIALHDTSDYSVCTTWAVHEHQYYLADVRRVRLPFTELKNAVVAEYEKYRPAAVLIENKASGQSLLQELRAEEMPLIAITPKEDKLQRFLRACVVFEAGKIYFPLHAPWRATLESELLSFPADTHDDQVDSVSQFINWMRKSQGFSPRVRHL